MKKRKEEIVNPTDFVDVTKFSYDDSVNVEIPGQLFYAIMRIIGTLANEEVKWMYQINPMSLAETAKQDNVVNVISNEGITYFNILGELETIHLNYIKEGKTIPIEELQEKIQSKINEVLKTANDADEKPNPKKKSKKNEQS